MISSHAAQSAKRERLEYHRHGAAAGSAFTNPRLLQRSSKTSKPTSSRTNCLMKQEPTLGSRKHSSLADAATVVPRPLQLPSKTSFSMSAKTVQPQKPEPFATSRRNSRIAGTAIVPRPL
ncbi:hypothetical protein QAD02_021300 [Eretmocerus hayati]|uniref:Uncharacterized protein n=1 Tax=Eretmocerus hayati TaxID=131215 RepID=A0ACC2PQ18_9HYME|nr:hypothetical protein QAD02_021300 [Eretmocerus hayati]